MEKKFIINKIADREVYDVEKLVLKDNGQCNLVLVNHHKKLVRENLPLNQVQSLLKKYNWFWAKFYGRKYCSEYAVCVLPYFDGEWYSFVWRDYIDGQEIFHDENFPPALSAFLVGFSNLYSRFLSTFEATVAKYKLKIPDSAVLSQLMDIYWAELSCYHGKNSVLLKIIYPLLLMISSDKKVAEEIDKPLSIEKFLCRTQNIAAEQIDYVQLAQDYFQSIYAYLLFCYQDDLCVLKDIYGDEKNIVNDGSIFRYSSFLCFLGAVEQVMTYFTDLQ